MTRLDVAVLVALVRLVAFLSVATLLVAPARAAEPDSVGSLTVEWATSYRVTVDSFESGAGASASPSEGAERR